jgi:hypothetical protein
MRIIRLENAGNGSVTIFPIPALSVINSVVPKGVSENTFIHIYNEN